MGCRRKTPYRLANPTCSTRRRPPEIYIRDSGFSRYAGFLGSQWAATNEAPTVRRLLRRFKNNEPSSVDLIDEFTTTKSPDQVYRDSRASTLAIFHVSTETMGVTSMGSGVIISESGAAITNFHVVANPPRSPRQRKGLDISKEVLIAGTMEGKFYPVTKLIAGSSNDDVAVVQLGGEGFVPAPLVTGKPVGTNANVISCPHFQMFQLTTGTVTRYHVTEERKIMSISADIGGGSSGGPVFDDCGNVIGITFAVRPLTRDGISLMKDDKTGFLKIAENAVSNLQVNRLHEMTISLCVPARSITRLVTK